MTEESKELLCLGLNTARSDHDLPADDTKYHPVEKVAYMASKNGFILDLIEEFDLSVDYENEYLCEKPAHDSQDKTDR